MLKSKSCRVLYGVASCVECLHNTLTLAQIIGAAKTRGFRYNVEDVRVWLDAHSKMLPTVLPKSLNFERKLKIAHGGMPVSEKQAKQGNFTFEDFYVSVEATDSSGSTQPVMKVWRLSTAETDKLITSHTLAGCKASLCEAQENLPQHTFSIAVGQGLRFYCMPLDHQSADELVELFTHCGTVRVHSCLATIDTLTCALFRPALTSVRIQIEVKSLRAPRLARLELHALIQVMLPIHQLCVSEKCR